MYVRSNNIFVEHDVDSSQRVRVCVFLVVKPMFCFALKSRGFSSARRTIVVFSIIFVAAVVVIISSVCVCICVHYTGSLKL